MVSIDFETLISLVDESQMKSVLMSETVGRYVNSIGDTLPNWVPQKIKI